jgi:protein TonB
MVKAEMFRSSRPREKLSGLIFAILLHGAAFYALWRYEIEVSPKEAMNIFVNFINGAPSAKKKEPPKPKAVLKPPDFLPPDPVTKEPPQLSVETPVTSPADPVAPPPPPVLEGIPEPSREKAPKAPLAGNEPVQLGTELAVTCPSRFPPDYPPYARSHREEGKVVVRVELDEEGKISTAVVDTTSGSPGLDSAALSAVKSWKCNPALRNGVATRAVALQPFLFKLQGR